MSSEPKDTRERVRELVREILKNTPAADEPEDFQPEHLLVNSLREKREREFDRDESAKALITEDDLRGLDNGARVRVRENVRMTPLAEDIIRERGIRFVTKQSRGTSLKVKRIAIGADHGGFATKEDIKTMLAELGLAVRDFGTNSTDAVDYPDFAHEVAKAVGAGHVDVGIVVDGAGIGSAMAANKVPNVRAAACYSVALAKNSREHNGANVLTLGSGHNSLEEMKEIVTAFLSEELTEERHRKRVGKIGEIEKQYKR